MNTRFLLVIVTMLFLPIGMVVAHDRPVASISGPTTVYAGSQTTYSYDDGGNYNGTQWTVTGGGSVVGTSQNGTQFTAIVLWSTSGSAIVGFQDESFNVTASLGVTVQACATSYTVTGGGVVCTTGVSVGLSGSQTGRTYQLLRNGANVGSAIAGTGGALTWSNITTAGTYSVNAIYSAGGCSLTMGSTVTVTTGTVPTLYTVSGGGSYCQGGTGVTIMLSSSQTNVTYSLLQGSTVVSSKSGTGAALSWTNIASAGTYTITAAHSTGCTVTMTGSATVSVSAAPTLYTVSGGGSFCSPGEGGVTLSLSGSETGVQYQPKINGVNTGSALAGTGSALQWTSVTAAGTYSVTATRTSTGCTATMNGTGTVTVNAGSVGGSLSPAAAYYYQPTNSGNITLSGYTGTILRWQKNTGTGWTDIANATALLKYDNLTVTTQYRAVVKNNACPEATSGITTISVFPKSQITGPTSVSFGGSIQLAVQNVYYQYQWYKNEVAINGATTYQLTVTTPGTYRASVKGSASAPEASSANFTVTSPVEAQSGINYHKVTAFKVAGVSIMPDVYSLPISSFGIVISYSDGLYRTIQEVAAAQSPVGTDVVLPHAYDNQGRVATQYLSYTEATHNGTYRPSAITSSGGYSGSSQYAFYQGTTAVAQSTAPFAQALFDNSPLDRAREQGAPGTAWQPGAGHTSKISSLVNSQDASAAAVLKNVRIWNADSPTTSYYSNSTLSVSRVIDPDGKEVYVFTDKLGRTVLKRVVWNGVVDGTAVPYLDTYYTYTIKGDIALQIPPAASAKLAAGTAWSSTFRDEWCFVYTYDNLGRLVEKKVPGAAAIYYGYDRLDRLVLTQDGNLRGMNQWLFFKYDHAGSTIMQGVYTNTIQVTRQQIQDNVLNPLYANENDPYFEIRGTALHGYTNQSFPATGIDVLQVNYYDGYDFDNNGTADFNYTSQGLPGEGTQATAFGMLTGSKQVVLGTTQWLYQYVFYDVFGRAIQIRKNNHLSATVDNLVTNVYDFEGKVVKTKNTHQGAEQITVVNTYAYDHAGRVTAIYQSNNGAVDQLAVQYEYNALGQLIDKKLHQAGTGFLQSVDYRYTIQGWLESINNAGLNVDARNDDADDFFGMEMLYDKTESGLGNTPYYNGNISSLKWKGAGGGAGQADQHSYSYTYDAQNQILQASFKTASTTGWDKETGTLNEAVSYDHNGNIRTLQRYKNARGASTGGVVSATPQLIDNLTYTYTAGKGNAFTKVEDAVTGTEGFANGANTTDEYTYGTQGGLIADKNKGIDSIHYNLLGKVRRIKFTSGKVMTYRYNAAGEKLTMSVYQGTTLQSKTDYVDGFVYENNVLNFFASPEGRVVKSGSSLEYQYAIADHQGNTRVLFSSVTPAPVATGATFEGDSNDKSGEFQNVTAGNVVTFIGANHTTGGSKVVRMNQTYKVGPAKSVKVFAGDKMDIEVWEYHEGTSGFGTAGTPASNLITLVAGAFGGVSGVAGESGMIYEGVNTALTAFGTPGNQGDERPAAYLNYILFDKNYKVLDAGWQVAPDVTFSKQKLSFGTLTIPEEGYLYAYLSYDNASANWVYFDDFKVTHTKNNIIQYNEYYPFGLQTASSWTRDNASNNFKYNAGTELVDANGWYETLFRGYDAALGRFLQVDPMADMVSSLSPYAYANNNPVLLNDPLGLFASEEEFNRTLSMLLAQENGGSWSESAGYVPFDEATANAISAMYGGPGDGTLLPEVTVTADPIADDWDPFGYAQQEKTASEQFAEFVEFFFQSELYKLNATENIKWSINDVDLDFKGEAGTTGRKKDGKILIRISMSAMRDPKLLYHTVGHELIHAGDYINGNYDKWRDLLGKDYEWYGTDAAMKLLMEYHAYTWDVATEAKFGTDYGAKKGLDHLTQEINDLSLGWILNK